MSTNPPLLFQFHKGDDVAFDIQVTDETTGLVLDITDWQFTVRLRLSPAETDDNAKLIAHFTADDSVRSQEGKLGIIFTNEQTKNLRAAPYFFDIQREVNGIISTISSGRVRVTATGTESFPNFTVPIAGQNTIGLEVTLHAASAETVTYMEEAKNYIATIENNIGVLYDNLADFSSAIMTTDNTYTDTQGNERYSWSAIEAYINRDDYAAWLSQVNAFTTDLEVLQTQRNVHQATIVNHADYLLALDTTQKQLVQEQVVQNQQYDSLNLLNTAHTATLAQHTTEIVELQDQSNDYEARLLSDAQELGILNTTYAAHNVWLEDHETRLINHGDRLLGLEQITDYAQALALVNSLDDKNDSQDARLDSVELIQDNYVADDRIEQSSVTQHQAAIVITESQISDLNTYATTADLQNETDAIDTELVALQTVITNAENASNLADTNLSNEITLLESYVDTENSKAVKLTGDQTIANTKTFSGNVIVEGTATLNNTIIKSSSELDVGDAIILLNAEESGTPSVDAGIEIERGSDTNAQLIWDESADKWTAGRVGIMDDIALEGYVDDNFVNLLNSQNIEGTKTFTARAKFNSGLDTDGLGTIDLNFIFSNAPIRYSAAALTNIVNDNELINKGYVDNLDDENFKKDGAQISTGNKTFENTITFADGGALIVDGTLTSNESNIFLNRPIVASATVMTETPAAGTLLWKEYVDDNFLKLTGGELSGQLNIIPATGNARLQFGVGNDFNQGHILYNSTSNSLNFSLSADGSGDTATNITLNNAGVYVNKAMYGVDHSHATSFTTKNYVDSNFLKLSDGTLTENLLLGDGITNNPAIKITSNASGNPTILLDRETDNVGKVLGLGNRLQLSFTNAITPSLFELYENVAVSSVPVRGQEGVNDLDYMTKQQIENNFISNSETNQQTITSNIELIGGLNTDNINADDATFILSSAPVHYASTVVSADFQASTLVPKSYVDDNHVNLTTNQTIAGAKTFNNNTKFDGLVEVDQIADHTSGAITAVNQMRYQPSVQSTIDSADNSRIPHKGWIIDNYYDQMYVDSNFVSLDANESIDGFKEFLKDIKIENNDGTSTQLTITTPAGNTNNPVLFFGRDGVNQGFIDVTAIQARLAYQGGTTTTTLGVFADYLESNKEHRGVDAVSGSAFTTLNQTIVQAANYKVIMPVATPTAGQKLEVGSVSGTDVTMIWV